MILPWKKCSWIEHGHMVTARRETSTRSCAFLFTPIMPNHFDEKHKEILEKYTDSYYNAQSEKALVNVIQLIKRELRDLSGAKGLPKSLEGVSDLALFDKHLHQSRPLGY